MSFMNLEDNMDNESSGYEHSAETGLDDCHDGNGQGMPETM